jgi:hypothetical protein
VFVLCWSERLPLVHPVVVGVGRQDVLVFALFFVRYGFVSLFFVTAMTGVSCQLKSRVNVS